MRTRRGFLAATAATLAGLGGCVSSNEDVDVGSATATETATTTRETTAAATRTRTRTRTRTETRTPTPRPTPADLGFGEAYEADGLAVELDRVGHFHSLIYQERRGRAGIATAEGTQFLFVDVRVTTGGSAPDPRDFVLVAGGEPVDRGWTRYSEFDQDGVVFEGAAETFGEPYDPESGRGWIGFAVPERFTERGVRIALGRGGRVAAEWSLPQATTDVLELRPPEWELGSFSGPGSSDGDLVELSITNRGNHESSFPVVMNYTGDVTVYEAGRELIPPGQTRIWRTQYSYGSPTDPDFEVVTPVRRYDFTN